MRWPSTGMEYGGITPVGLPDGWPILVDEAVAALDWILIGSGIRGSKIIISGAAAADLPGAEVLALAVRPEGAALVGERAMIAATPTQSR